MLKRLVAALFITLMMSLPAMAIEPPAGATIPYEGKNAAYTAAEFNEVLEAYGLMLSSEAAKTVPSSFAKVEGDTIMFGDHSMAYRSSEYHSILSAYGLTLTPEDVSAKLGSLDSYATVKDGKVVFSDRGNLAYRPDEIKMILGAYSKSM